MVKNHHLGQHTLNIMPTGGFQYLEGNPANIYATRELGNTFYNAAIGLAMERNRQANRAAELAFQERELAAKLPIYEAQQRNYAAEAAWHQARTKQAEAEALAASQQQQGSQLVSGLAGQGELTPEQLGRIVMDPVSGPAMFGNLRKAGVFPEGATQISMSELAPLIRAAVYGQTMGTATSSPVGAASLARPVEGSQFGQFNPFTRQQVLAPQAGVLTPYQQDQLRLSQELRDETERHNVETEAEQMRYHQLDAIVRGMGGMSGMMNPGAVQQEVNKIYPKTGSGDRIRVQSPDGRVGTIQRGDTVPPGWKILSR